MLRGYSNIHVEVGCTEACLPHVFAISITPLPLVEAMCDVNNCAISYELGNWEVNTCDISVEIGSWEVNSSDISAEIVNCCAKGGSW
jgi:hypothetical protein